MSKLLDLLAIAQAEQQGLEFQLLDGLFNRSRAKLRAHPDAVIWKGGNHDFSIHPVTHAFTDKFALLGTLMAADVLNLPWWAIPMTAQYRHDQDLAPLAWFGSMQGTLIKWSTAGDIMVNKKGGGKCVVKGKSGNAPLRTAAGVFCNVRPYGTITSVRCMPCLPYSQNGAKFSVDPATGIIHSEMNTPGIQMAYAARHFLHLVNQTGHLGRVAFKPTQAQEDGVGVGLLLWMLQGTKFKITKKYEVDAYAEHKARVDAIVALLPSNFREGMDSWTGEISMHIADTNYGILLHDIVEQRNVIVWTTDLDGDRLTDLMADAPAALRAAIQSFINFKGLPLDANDLWPKMGHTTTNGRDMTSVMHRMNGDPIFEQTLGSADAMLNRLLDGDETVGDTKDPYDPRIHFVLIADAYKAANPGNDELAHWLDEQITKFDQIYSGKRPRFLDGYAALKAAITPWRAAV